VQKVIPPTIRWQPNTSTSVSAVQQLVIVGAGGHGREMLDIVEAINAVEPTYEFLGFVAADADPALLARRGASLLGDLGFVLEHDVAYAIGIGDSTTRLRIDDDLRERGRQAVTLVHPLASTGSDLRFDDGVALAAGARVTTNVTLGRQTQLNVNAVVSHDCVIGEGVTLSPGVLVNGTVVLGDRVFLGTGAIVLPGRTVGPGARIGAGAVVVDDVAAGVTVTGVPARAKPDR
jgi:sugar O-acyltransferase (sialic acid O-acetyltransferase NeuD family)